MNFPPTEPGGGLWDYLSELAACEDVQTYVRQHQFGKRAEEDENRRLLAKYICLSWHPAFLERKKKLVCQDVYT